VALTRLDLGETALALIHQGEALEIYRRLGERVWTAEAHMHLGDIHAAAGEPDRARREWDRSLELYRELDHPAAEQVRSRLSSAR
jgi:predicted negative regulator of RcsB-dependent stress response